MQEYKLILRAITGGATQVGHDGAIVSQNASEFMSYLNDQYLSQGYTIMNVETIRTIPANDQAGTPALYGS